VSEQSIQQYSKPSFFKKQIFNFKINVGLKNCNKIKEYLISKDYLGKYDSKLNLITSDGFNSEVENSYLLYKGYNKDGSIKPIKKYSIISGEIKECSSVIKGEIIILDLYEKSIYLHSHVRDSQYITGFIIKEKISSERDKTLIFSNEKVKINIKNINKFETNNFVDDFVNKYIM
jgi:hypothetical protein